MNIGLFSEWRLRQTEAVLRREAELSIWPEELDVSDDEPDDDQAEEGTDDTK